jgi:hypothetical protein
MGVINGTPVNASNTNAAFLNKNQADQMTFPLSLTSTLAISKRDESSAATINALATSTALVRITGTVATLNGAVAPTTYTDGSLLIVSNASANTITINHESGSATAANRFALPGSTLLTLTAGQAVQFYYDTTAARWRAAAGSGAGGGGASAWATSYAYQAGNSVTYSGNLFLALTNHTSGSTFEADFALGYWRIINRPVLAKNYFDVGSNFESNTVSGWQLFTTTLTGVIPTGSLTLGTAASISIAATSTSPLSGTYSLAVGNTASTNITAGQGIISQVYALDQVDQAKVLATRFAYKAAANLSTALMNFSGTSSNTWAVYIYDVTNSAWIQPAGVYNLVQSSGVGIQTGTWQTPSNMSQFRIALVCVNSTTGTTPAANAYQMIFDEFYVGPQAQASGPFVGDWQDFPSVAAGTLLTATTSNPTYGTVQHNKAQWRRVGSDMEIRWDFRQSTAGTGGSGTYLFNLPAGYQMDSSKVTISATNDDSKSVGVFDYKDGTTIGTGYLVAHTSIAMRWVMQFNNAGTSYGTGTINSTFGQLTNALVEYSIKARVPILGWSSNSVQSSDTDTRVVAARYYQASNTTQGANFLDWPTKDFDTHSAATTGSNVWKYTVPVAGTYRVTVEFSGVANSNIYLYKNGSQVTAGRLIYTQSTGNGNGSQTVFCVAGDYLQVSSGGANLYNGAICIERISGPATIAASEQVAAAYWASANGTANTTTPINFDSKEFDTHGAVTTGASWKFTAPRSDIYTFGFVANQSAGATIYWHVYKNGTIYKLLNYATAPPGFNFSCSTQVYLNAGEYIDIRSSASAPYSGGALSSNSGSNFWIRTR